jgi:hypothetical protein
MELFSYLHIMSGLVLKECRGVKTIERTAVRCLLGSVVTRKSRVCRQAELWHAMVEMEPGGS